ncbi:MAG TPA: spermidine synthase, partial [Mycobacteriales bacterium]
MTDTAGGQTAEPATSLAGRRARLTRAGLLFATFACAACGLVYELALVAQGSYLL